MGAAGGVAPTLAICTTLGNSARQEMGTTSCRVRARVLRGEVGGSGWPPTPSQHPWVPPGSLLTAAAGGGALAHRT